MAAYQAPSPWDSPGKNTGVGCHFLLQCRKVKSESEVAQSCLTLSNPMDCSLPGSSVHGIFPGKSTGVGCHCLLWIIFLRKTLSGLLPEEDEPGFHHLWGKGWWSPHSVCKLALSSHVFMYLWLCMVCLRLETICLISSLERSSLC